MAKFIGEQLSLIAESDLEYCPVGDWEWDDVGTEKILVPTSPISKVGTEKILVPTSPISKVGTKKFLVPNSPGSKLGTNKNPVPNSPLPELGTDKNLVPNSDNSELGGCKNSVPNCDDWKPPVGCLQQKWIKDRQYWYWRYYDNRRKKRSLYLGRDYNKAILKAQKIGIPPDANSNHRHPPQTDSQT